MPVLCTDLRNKLAKLIGEARELSEAGSKAALEALAVHEAKPYQHMSPEQKELRNRLRALGRQLGDRRDGDKGTQGITHLLQTCAYEHWHRMLFARFLAENDLLIHPEMQVAVTLQECEELAKEEGVNLWTLASRYAQRMLPQVFRADHPAFELTFPREYQTKLEKLLEGLEADIFTAQDSLGWVYQFWQAKEKERVNKSEVKIGADELPAVTQLFTEHYMVMFLLDNSLGAWWAARRLTQADWQSAGSEDELRRKAAIPGVPLEYLRFVKNEDGTWQPAAGAFEQWPDNLAEFKLLDPCCGSGHFLLAAFHMLVPIRRELEKLSAREAIDAVLRDNLHGLEIDQRCVEIAVFALALEAWRYPDTGGYRPLPELHLACSGLPVSVKKEEWQKLAEGHKNLRIAMGILHEEARHAPVLGSLLNPQQSDAAKLVDWDNLADTIQRALEKEHTTEEHEAGVVAQGLVKAAQLLGDRYTLVITNVPYLTRGKQTDRLRDFCATHYPAAKNDLATVFLDRCLQLCHEGGTVSNVLPQNWLFLTSYRKFREQLLRRDTWHLIARLGAQGFQTPMWDFNVQLLTISRGVTDSGQEGLFADDTTGTLIHGLDVAELRPAAEKAAGLLTTEVVNVEQSRQLRNPDARVLLYELDDVRLLGEYVEVPQGIKTGDDNRFRFNFWEIFEGLGWKFYQSTPESNENKPFSGLSNIIRWENDGETLARRQGDFAWGKKGIAISQMASMPWSYYNGEIHDSNINVVVPVKEAYLLPVLAYCTSKEFGIAIRQIDQKLSVTNATLKKIPFDLDHWSTISRTKYPNGLHEPYSNDSTQWIFHGHPCGSVIWSEGNKQLEHGPLRVDDTVLHVAVARLLGYRWPAELDDEMELSEESRQWVAAAQKLNEYTDDDGIVCLPAIRGELPAHQRLLRLLEAAYGDKWNAGVLNQLLKAVDCEGKTLDVWLRDKFFDQHCALFHQRPFIWHIWDGLKDGFSALVNYHQLDRANMERLIYTYLGDWIGIQEAAVRNGEDGAEERLAAARALKQKLEAILEGEDPLDIFVRWKPVEQQPIGWEPDLNDGVRLNIRPFMLAGDVGKKGAGVLRAKPKINWNKDRGKDVSSAPWFDTFKGERINDHHLSLEEKRTARECNQKVTA